MNALEYSLVCAFVACLIIGVGCFVISVLP